MKRSLILTVLAVVVLTLAVVSLPGKTSARTLTEQEMWLTFGGFQVPNDKYCEWKLECWGDPTNDCVMADGSFAGWCESEVGGAPRFDHDVVTEQQNMLHCGGISQGWFCEDFITTFRCMMKLRCQWDNQADKCKPMSFPAGYVSEVRVPELCSDFPTGM